MTRSSKGCLGDWTFPLFESLPENMQIFINFFKTILEVRINYVRCCIIATSRRIRRRRSKQEHFFSVSRNKVLTLIFEQRRMNSVHLSVKIDHKVSLSAMNHRLGDRYC